MNYQRLFAMVVMGMLLSACTQYEPYRTPTFPVVNTSPPEWPPKCAVDDAAVLASKDKGPELGRCEDKKTADSQVPEVVSAAIQHRFYQTQDEQEGDYYLSFVEFDDQGWFADRRQMDALFTLLETLEKQDKKTNNGHTLIYVYAHGWKHNASACDNNVVCFSRLLERHDLAEKTYHLFNTHETKNIRVRKVVGVYLGWRGLPFDSALNNVSFWSRKDAAARVGRGGVLELLARLKDYRDSRQQDFCRSRLVDIEVGNQDSKKNIADLLRKSPDCENFLDDKKQQDVLDGGSPTQLVITGHSFGGLVIYEALSHALIERAAKTTKIKKVDGATENGVEKTKEVTQYDVAKSFGDFVMLVNPAFEGSLYEPLFHIATNRCYDNPDNPKRVKQRPVMMIVTSEADSATRVAFPMGRYFSTLLQHKKSDEQADSMSKTIGHNPRYVTHELRCPTCMSRISNEDDTAKCDDCGCPYLPATSGSTLEKLLGPVYKLIIKKAIDNPAIDPAGKDFYGSNVELASGSSATYALEYPYLVIKTDENVITDHNAIYNDRFVTFAQQFFVAHIVKGIPLPGDTINRACRRDEAAYPQRKKGSLLPSEQSCWLAGGKSCSVPVAPVAPAP